MGHGGAADGPPVGRDAPAVSRVAVALHLEATGHGVRAGPHRTGRSPDPKCERDARPGSRAHTPPEALTAGQCAQAPPQASDPCRLEGGPSPHLKHGETEAPRCRETCSLRVPRAEAGRRGWHHCQWEALSINPTPAWVPLAPILPRSPSWPASQGSLPIAPPSLVLSSSLSLSPLKGQMLAMKVPRVLCVPMPSSP